MAARMDQMKDYPLLISAAMDLGRREPDRWRFVLVGSGPARERLISQARGVRGCAIEFVEMGLEALPAVASADIGVLATAPPYAEGCSNSIMEYMALGLPVVCSDSGGNREIVDDGNTGFVIPPTDVDALVRALQRLGSDAELRAAFGADWNESGGYSVYRGGFRRGVHPSVPRGVPWRLMARCRLR